MDKKIKILLVDDEPDFLESLAFWFNANGYSVTTAASGQEALNKIQENMPNIVFLDVFMSEMNGLITRNKIKEINENIPIIMMSAYLEKGKHGEEDSFFGVSDVFYKEDGLPKAQELLESALKNNKS